MNRISNTDINTIKKITDFIFVHDKPVKADAVFVVGGSLPQAAETAADLYKQGYSDKIFIGGKYSIKRNSFPIPEFETEYDFYKDILLKNCVCEKDIYGEKESLYTKQNAEFAKKAADKSNVDIKTAIIICKAFHAKRCLLFYQMYFPNVDFAVVTFDGFDISRDNWYKSEYGIKRVLGEIERIGNQVSPELVKDIIINTEIRPAETEDADKIYDFYKGICKALENEKYSPLWQIGAYPCPKDIEDHIKNGNMYIAVNSNKIISAMAAANHGDYTSLHLFAILPEYRGTDLSADMMKTLIAIAKNRKNSRIILDVVKGNLPAEKLYQKVGFKLTGEKCERIKRIGNVRFNIYEYQI